MSEDASKTVIRLYIRELDNASVNDAFEYFKSKFKEPDDVDEYNGEIEYFNYKKDYSVTENDDKWYFDIILEESRDGYQSISISLKKLFDIIEKYCNFFNVSFMNDINIASYTWYTGVDEPFDFVKE